MSRKKQFSEWVAEVSRNTPTSKTINSELSRASQLPNRQDIKVCVNLLRFFFWSYFSYYPLKEAYWYPLGFRVPDHPALEGSLQRALRAAWANILER